MDLCGFFVKLLYSVAAYLASRRGSRDSQCSNVSNVSNEDVGPLNFSAHPRVRQRRTSNFLELPGEYTLSRLFAEAGFSERILRILRTSNPWLIPEINITSDAYLSHEGEI